MYYLKYSQRNLIWTKLTKLQVRNWIQTNNKFMCIYESGCEICLVWYGMGEFEWVSQRFLSETSDKTNELYYKGILSPTSLPWSLTCIRVGGGWPKKIFFRYQKSDKLGWKFIVLEGKNPHPKVSAQIFSICPRGFWFTLFSGSRRGQRENF